MPIAYDCDGKLLRVGDVVAYGDSKLEDITYEIHSIPETCRMNLLWRKKTYYQYDSTKYKLVVSKQPVKEPEHKPITTKRKLLII